MAKLRQHIVVRVVAGTVGVAILVGLPLLYWLGQERIRWISRQSMLLVVRHYLEEDAKRRGTYPPNLLSVKEIRSSYFSRGLLRPGELEYVAAGKPYSARADERLFYEREPRTYGWKTGYFDISQRRWYFRRGHPHLTEGLEEGFE